MKVTTDYLIEQLQKFPKGTEVVFVPPADQGDAEYTFTSIDEWNDLCAISLYREE